jgi:hypothetical protein
MAVDIIKKNSTNKEVREKLLELYDEIFRHDGYGDMKVEIRILQRGQKEVIIHCGKQYRFVVDYIKCTSHKSQGHKEGR